VGVLVCTLFAAVESRTRAEAAELADNPPPTAHDRDAGLSLARFPRHPLFASDGPSKDDVFQGDDGDCYFMSALAALAEAHPSFIRKTVTDLGDGTYLVRFFRPNGEKNYIRVTGELWVDAAGAPRYARLGREGCLWVALIEKAFAVCRRKPAGYGSLIGGNGTALNNIVWKYNHLLIDETNAQPDDVLDWFKRGAPDGPLKELIHTRVAEFLERVDAERHGGHGMVMGGPVGFSDRTPLVPARAGPAKSTYRRGQHIYMVDHVQRDAAGHPAGIVLRNPNGRYLTLTDFVRIYFCSGRAATVEPPVERDL
jgi:hypothetical protein